MCVTINVIQNMPISILVNFYLLNGFYILISKIKTLLIDYQLEECSSYVLKIVVNLSLDVLIKQVLIKKKTECNVTC